MTDKQFIPWMPSSSPLKIQEISLEERKGKKEFETLVKLHNSAIETTRVIQNVMNDARSIGAY
tara:strand:+ start:519 stop:707 length:189 start_codon:yes stop_codon:yes gene_type:complete